MSCQLDWAHTCLLTIESRLGKALIRKVKWHRNVLYTVPTVIKYTVNSELQFFRISQHSVDGSALGDTYHDSEDRLSPSVTAMYLGRSDEIAF